MSITSDMIKSNGFIHALADDAANEIDDLEKAYELLYAENSKNVKRIAELEAVLALSTHRIHSPIDGDPCVCSQCRFVFERDRAMKGGA